MALHDASTIAAVIVEPMAGSTGVLPAPKGYLARLRAICDKHGILLIFDEVITGFGRLGYAFAAERYGVLPDMITFAKGITSGTVPMGGVIVRKAIYDAFMRGPEHVVELFHGYTYSAHPLACAAGLATLDLYRDEDLFARAQTLEPIWADAAMSLKGLPNVLDIRCVGLTAGIDLASRPDDVGKRAYDAMEQAFHDGEPGHPRHRRDHRAHAAADRERTRDRGDLRQGRPGDQSGGVKPLPQRRPDHPPRECRQRTQDRPADGEDLIAAPERQRERRLHLGIAGDAAQRQRHDGRIAAGPHHHRSLGAQIAEIDPGRTAGIAVDQHPRLLARVVADIAAGPHIRDHVDERPAGGGAKAPRELIREPIAGIEHRAVALIERRQHRIIGGEDERKQHEYYGP